MMAAAHHATGGQVFTITAEDRLLRFGMKHDGYEAEDELAQDGIWELLCEREMPG